MNDNSTTNYRRTLESSESLYDLPTISDVQPATGSDDSLDFQLWLNDAQDVFLDDGHTAWGVEGHPFKYAEPQSMAIERCLFEGPATISNDTNVTSGCVQDGAQALPDFESDLFHNDELLRPQIGLGCLSSVTPRSEAQPSALEDKVAAGTHFDETTFNDLEFPEISMNEPLSFDWQDYVWDTQDMYLGLDASLADSSRCSFQSPDMDRSSSTVLVSYDSAPLEDPFSTDRAFDHYNDLNNGAPVTLSNIGTTPSTTTFDSSSESRSPNPAQRPVSAKLVRRAQYTQRDWERVKPPFIQLYIHERKSLSEVMRVLAQQHNFRAR